MTEVALAAAVVALIALHVWTVLSHVSERRRLTNALVARTPAEFVQLERATTPKPKTEESSEVRPRPHGL